MKKLILLIFTFILVNPAFANNIFQHHEEYYADESLPFFVNIYSDDFDIKEQFEEQKLEFTPQVKFLNKRVELAKAKRNENFFISAYKTKSVTNQKLSEQIDVVTDFMYGKWDLKSGISQEVISGLNQYYNSFEIEPTYNFNEYFTVFGGVSHSITDKYDQTRLGVRYSPKRFKNFKLELSVSNYTKQYTNYRQKMNFSTIFKI